MTETSLLSPSSNYLDNHRIPLHTNGSQYGIRCQVTKNHVGGGNCSDTGRDCQYAFL